MLVYEKTSIYFAVKLSLTEIFYVMYAHALICALNEAKIVRSRDTQCNTVKSP